MDINSNNDNENNNKNSIVEMESVDINNNSNNNTDIENNEKINNKKKDKKNNKKDEKKKKEEAPPPPEQVPFFSLFRFAEPLDYLLIILGSIGAIANGTSIPLMSIIFGEVMKDFSYDNLRDPNFDLVAAVTSSCLYFVWLGIGVFVASYLEIMCWMMAGERQAVKCRLHYFKAIIRQEVGWYDVTKPSELSTRISSDTQLFQEAIGEKVGNLLHHFSTFITGFVVGFIYGWQLALVILSLTPLIAMSGGVMARMMTNLSKDGQDAYAQAGAIAEEKIGSMRTVVTFSGEQKEINNYKDKLQEALKVGTKKGLMNGLGMGMIFLIMFSSYSLSFWFGAKLIKDERYNPFPKRDWVGGDVLTVFLSVVMSSMSLGQTSPSMASIASGRGAAFKIFQVINRKSLIDPLSTGGIICNNLQGDIEFRNVQFSYPSRPDVPIFKNFNLKIKPGTTFSFVGSSGSGKSTVVSLLERFYNPDAGEIYLDGININQYNISSLRKNIGLVSQEPVLFAMSIADNIRFGNENATLEQIIEACKIANAHDFISALPEGYDTQVGEKGVQMSGGQRQRICIARMVILDPKLLLLDEATSALDSQNEYLVQNAIEKLMKGRTTIAIAHRLSSIQNSDAIAVVKNGEIIEQGTHNELYKLGGAYTVLVDKQKRKNNNNSQEEGCSTPDIKIDDDNHIEEEKPIEVVDNSLATVVSKTNELDTLEDSNSKKSVPLSRILKYNKKDWHLFVIGIIGAGVNGSIMPIFSVVFSEILKIFQSQDPEELSHGARNMALWFFLIAVCAMVANILQAYCFTAIGERLTFTLRRLSFQSIMRQDIGWFDLPENSTGRLTTNLATEATLVQGITSQRLALIVQNFISIVVGLVIAFISGWKLTLVVLSLVPILAFAGKIEMDFMGGFSKKSKGAYRDCGQIATEAIGGIRTVNSFAAEEKVLTKFKNALSKPLRLGYYRSNVGGLSYGFSQGAMYFIYALAFWYGGKLVYKGEWKASQSDYDKCLNGGYIDLNYPTEESCMNSFTYTQGYSSLLRVLFAILMSAMGVGQAMSFLPDIAKAKNAAIAIFELIDRVSEVDPFLNNGESPQNIHGNIELKNIKFAYPSRPNRIIFENFNLSIPQGKKVALVGDSGSGKSSIIGLLERFYNPLEGSITIDGVDIKDLNLNWLRGNLGLVGQEPFLFSGTIFENITYGKPDGTMDQVIEAAKAANAHDFISELPDGYHTQLGDKFTQLSGGQKQRVAIARAIIRDPKILLLDEATSALDSTSESIVQAALDNVVKGRTSIVIAHRLSTVIDADIIVVLKDGKVIEIGNHDSLLQLNGFYTKLVSRQIQ